MIKYMIVKGNGTALSFQFLMIYFTCRIAVAVAACSFLSLASNVDVEQRSAGTTFKAAALKHLWKMVYSKVCGDKSSSFCTLIAKVSLTESSGLFCCTGCSQTFWYSRFSYRSFTTRGIIIIHVCMNTNKNGCGTCIYMYL